jgi:hypothetical protein
VQKAGELRRDPEQRQRSKKAGLISLSGKTLQDRIPILEERHLVGRPPGRDGKPSQRMGVGITAEGLKLIND